MGLLQNIKKYQLNRLNSEQETLFTYFNIRYEIDNKNVSNPYVVISLTTKIKEIEVARLYIDHKGNEDSKCYFCFRSHCEHLQIMVTKILENPAFLAQIEEADYNSDNYIYIEQQNEFDQEINEIFDSIYNEESSTLIHLAHITPSLEDVRNAYALELKVGINRSYKVPSVYQFLMRFKHKETFQYGKELKLVHKLNNFDEPSANLINYLKDNIEHIDRYVTLKKKALDSVCEIYMGHYIEIDNETYFVSNENLNIQFHIDNQFHIHLQYLDSDYSSFGENFYINKKEKVIKQIVSDKRLSALIDSINRYPLANIKNRIYEFKHAYFLKYPDLFTFDEEVQGILHNEPLKIQSYFDYEKKDDTLTVETKYLRDNEEINPEDLTNIYEKKFINQYLDILSKYGFNEGKITNHADVFNFINGSLEDIRLLSEVYISESLSKMNLITFSAPTIRVQRSGNIIEVFMDDSEYDEKELKQILSALKKKKKYIILKDNFIDLSSSSCEVFYDAMEQYEMFSKNGVISHNKLPLYYAFKSINDDSQIETDSLINDVFTQVKEFSVNKLNIPKINGKLRSYQKDGVKWLHVLYQNGLGGILADDMGLGKTIETISFIKCVQKDSPILIVCPKSLIYNWQSEFRRFAPELPTYAIHGTVSERKKIINNIKDNSFGVYFISYDSLRNEVDNLKDIHFDICILDEAQFIKNAMAKKTSAVKSISASHLFALTGTPIENNIFDLWSIFDFLMPGYLSDLKEFKTKYENIESYPNAVKVMTSPFILRRRKEDVLKDLPDKYEVIYTVDMTDEQRKIYEAYRIQMKKLLEEDSSQAMQILGAITRLRQICVDPSMFIENYQGGSGKIDYLLEVLTEKISDGHRVLVFSQFVKVLENIEVLLRKNDISYKVITGDTPAQERLNICNDFNNSEEIKVVLISLKAGGTGLNLVGADTVIHIDPWWNLAAQNQASDRAHRIGQTRAVEVIKIIAENSIEQKVLDIQNEKKELVELMIADNDESIKKLSIDELKSLLFTR